MSNSVSTVVSNSVFVDRKKAEEFLAKNTHNRPLRKDHVLTLKKEMLEQDHVNGGKKFKHSAQTIKFDKNGRLIDGQHRCEAIVEADKAEPGIGFWFSVEEGHEPYMVEYIDNGQKQRNLFDNLSYRIDTKEHRKFYKKICADVEKMYGGIGNLKTSERARSSEKVDYIIQNESILAETNKIFEVPKSVKPHGFNEPHYRAAFHTSISEDPSNTEKYRDFAKMLVGNIETSRKDPIHALKEKMTDLEAKLGAVGQRMHSHTRMAYTLQAIEDQKNGIDASKKSYELKPAKHHAFSKTKYSLDKEEKEV